MKTRQDSDLICSFCSDSVWLPRVCDIGKLIWHYVKCSELCNEQVTSDTVDGHTVDTLIKICLQDPTSLHSGLLEEILAFKSIISSCLRSHTGHTGHWSPHQTWSVPTQSVKNIMYIWKIIWIWIYKIPSIIRFCSWLTYCLVVTNVSIASSEILLHVLEIMLLGLYVCISL